MIKITVINIAIIQLNKFCLHYQVIEIDVITVDTYLVSQCKDSVLSNENDAMQVLLQVSKTAMGQNGHKPTHNDMRQGLSAITGTETIQGVSGQIAFDGQGDPVNKALVLLSVDDNGFIHMEGVLGQFSKS